jgi:hypothetical protein
MVGEKERKMKSDLPWFGNGAYVHLVFSYSLLVIITIEWKGLYIGYMGNRERDTQVTEPKLNGLGPNIQWIRLLGPNII